MIGLELANRIGAARAAQSAAQIFERAQRQVPNDVTVERVGDGIMVRGRALFRRALSDARLRGIGR